MTEASPRRTSPELATQHAVRAIAILLVRSATSTLVAICVAALGGISMAAGMNFRVMPLAALGGIILFASFVVAVVGWIGAILSARSELNKSDTWTSSPGRTPGRVAEYFEYGLEEQSPPER